MNDERQAAAVIGLVILIGLVGLFLTGGFLVGRHSQK